MAGTAHYRNSKISTGLYEPVYNNLFDVLLTFPAAIAGEPVDLVLEEVTKVTGLAVDQTPATAVEQIYKGAKRTFPNALPESTTVNVGLEMQVNLNEANSMFAYKALRKWTDLIWDPLRGTMNLKRDYVGGPMIVSLYNRKGDVFRQYTFPTVWPMTSIPPIDMDYTSGANIYTLGTIEFRSDFWDDVSL